MKRTNVIILFTMFICMVGTKAFAYDIAVVNSKRVFIYYNFINNNTELEVTNNGYRKYIESVDIPSTVKYKDRIYKVTSIAKDAFSGCTTLASVSIPNSITFIAESAFSGCAGLTSVTIPKSIMDIGKSAFEGCTRLNSMTIPSSVTTIGESAFKNCTNLSSITIGDGVTTIGESAFFGCINLKSIKFGENVVTIGASAFQNCRRLSSATIPNSVTTIGNSAFSGCTSLSSLTISNNVTNISEHAFEYCIGLTSVTIGNNVESIGNSAFYFCSSLSSIIIPQSVARIGDAAFTGCKILSSVTIPINCEINDGSFGAHTKVIRGEPITAIASNPKSTNKQPVKADQIPNLTIIPKSITFVDASGNNAVVGGQNYTISFKVQNTGKGAARKCKAKVTAKGSTQGIGIKDVSIDDIKAGETKTVDVPIAAALNTQNGQVEFAIQVDEPNGFGTDPHYLTVNTQVFEAPMVQITDYSLTGTTGNTLKKKQPFDLQLMLQNTKFGQADDVSISIEIPQNVLMLDGNQKQTFAALKGGETKSLVYSLIVNNNYQGSTIPVKVHVKEKYGKYAENSTINLTLDQALASTKINVEAQQQSKGDIHIATIGSDVDKGIPVSSKSNNSTFAVIIGNENYQKVSKVPFAQNDAATFAMYCQKTLGLPQKNIRSYKDATYATMLSAIRDIQDIAKAYNGDLNVVFYYAGHGIPNESSGDAFLLPVDADGRQTEVCYPLNRLYSELGAMEARSVTVFMDACFSGSERGNNMLASARGVAIKAKQSAPQGNMVIFSAAQGDETAYPYKEKGHGLFTYFLLKKLQETEGDVSLSELGSYIVDNVVKESIVSNGKSQTPTIIPSQTIVDSWKTMKLK